jgi:endoglucanase
MAWATAKHNGANYFRSGYALDGSNILGNNYATGAFIPPTGVAAMVTGHQAWLNAAFDYAISRREKYYEDSISLICALIMTGNGWLPGVPEQPQNQN